MFLKVISIILCVVFFVYELVSLIKTIKQRKNPRESSVAEDSNSNKEVNQ